jgi:hypothetical protein
MYNFLFVRNVIVVGIFFLCAVRNLFCCVLCNYAHRTKMKSTPTHCARKKIRLQNSELNGKRKRVLRQCMKCSSSAKSILTHLMMAVKAETCGGKKDK